MDSVENIVATKLSAIVPGYLARNQVGKVLEELNKLIVIGRSAPSQVQDPMNWFPLLDAIDELEQVKESHGHLYRATYLRVKACRLRLMLDPEDHYSHRELDQVRHRLLAGMKVM